MAKQRDLNLQILSEDYKAPISLEKLDQLSSIQLAIAAGTSEVDTLTRQRAYHAFVTRKKEYRPGASSETDPLLEVAVDVPVPSSMDRCSPTQLLLYRFNPKCNSNDLVQLATSKLFAKVKAYQDGMTLAHTSNALSQALKRADPVPQDEVSTAPAAERPKVTENDAAVMIGLNSCEAYGLAEGEGEVDMGAGEPRLILSEDAAQIVDCDGKEVCLISISLISEVEFEFEPEASIGRRACTLKICAANATEPSDDGLDTERTLPSLELHLNLGMLELKKPPSLLTSLLLRLSFPPRGRPSRPGDYEDMQDYVAAFLQIRRARSLIDRAYSRVLQEALYPAQSRGDPDRRLANNRVQVIEKLRTHLREGDNFFSESRQSLIQVPHFAPSDFGPDVYDSFRRSLDRIVQTEKDILHR